MILNWSSQQGKQAFSPRYLSHKYCRLLLLLQAVSLNQSSINIAPLFVTQKSVYFILIGFISKEKSCVYFLSPYIHNLSLWGGLSLSAFFFFFLISHLLITCFSEKAGAFTASYKWYVLKEQCVACCPLM